MTCDVHGKRSKACIAANAAHRAVGCHGEAPLLGDPVQNAVHASNKAKDVAKATAANALHVLCSAAKEKCGGKLGPAGNPDAKAEKKGANPDA